MRGPRSSGSVGPNSGRTTDIARQCRRDAALTGRVRWRAWNIRRILVPALRSHRPPDEYTDMPVSRRCMRWLAVSVALPASLVVGLHSAQRTFSGEDARPDELRLMAS